MEKNEPIFRCYKCSEKLAFDTKIGRRDMCPNCHAYLHCCKNCGYWDPNVHNQCTENRSEFIRDREEGNFCLYFTFKESPEEAVNEAAAAKEKLSKLFGVNPGSASKAPQTPEDAMEKLKKLFR